MAKSKKGPVNVCGKLGRESNQLLSQNVKLSYDTYYTKQGSLNTLVIGGTGEGKSRGFVKPSVYSLPVLARGGDAKPLSFVFTDPKGELCNETAGFLAANGYEIKVFNINEPRYSDCFNPFRYIRSSDSLLIMVDSVVDNASGGKTPSDPYWSQQAKTILNSICYLVYLEFPFKDQNFTTVSELLNMFGSSENDDNYKCDYDLYLELLEKESPLGEEHPAIVWRKKCSAKGRELSSIISSAQNAVRLFASKDIQRLTSVDTIEMDLIGDKPTALYIIIPTTNDTYNFLISLMYTQLFESLYYRAQNVFNGSLPHHVRFFLDEFANVGKIISFDKKISTFRSVNLSACMIVQSPNQIETLYDKASADIIDNVHQIVFIGSGGQGEKSATKWMSNALGTKTIQAESSQVQKSKTPSMFGIDGTTVQHSYSAQSRPLMTQDELYRLPSDRCIVMIKGQKPFYDYKINPDTCLNFSNDKYSKIGKFGRVLRDEYLYPINDKNPNLPARKRTSESFRLGLKNSHRIDLEQSQMRKKEKEEDAKYEVIVNDPTFSVAERISLIEDAKKFEK